MRASFGSTVRSLTRLALAALVATVCFGNTRTASAAPVAMTADEFKLYKDYTAALNDARVKKMSESKRVPAIARNFKVSEKVLRNAIAKGDVYGKNADHDCEQEVRALLDKSELRGRIQDVKVDASEGHVVTYVSWKNTDGTKLDQEAALVALLAAKGAPITSTIALWANDKATTRKVFDAKISADAAGHFSQDHIAMFASARYIRVFEDVHNAYKGTPPVN